MLVYEYKLSGTKQQYAAIDEVIRIVQFIRNKSLRLLSICVSLFKPSDSSQAGPSLGKLGIPLCCFPSSSRTALTPLLPSLCHSRAAYVILVELRYLVNVLKDLIQLSTWNDFTTIYCGCIHALLSGRKRIKQ